MAGVKGLEPSTSCVTGRRSNQLSYTPIQDRHTFNRFFFKMQHFFLKKIKKMKLFYVILIFQYVEQEILNLKKPIWGGIPKKRVYLTPIFSFFLDFQKAF